MLPDDGIVVAVHTSNSVEQVEPDGRRSPVATLPVPPAGLVARGDGGFYVAGGAPGVSPGRVAGTDAYLSMPEAAREAMYAAVAARLPAGIVGRAEHVASLALEVATNPFVTGTVIDIDGGGIVA